MRKMVVFTGTLGLWLMCGAIQGREVSFATGATPGTLFQADRKPASSATALNAAPATDRHGMPFLLAQALGQNGDRISKPHRVVLSWQRSQDGLGNGQMIAGYNVYRCSSFRASCARINPSLVTEPEFVDDAVRGGTTYYYSTTAVDQNGRQSRRSNIVKVVVPYP